MKDDVRYLDCGNCGAEIVGSHPRAGWYSDGEDIVCPDCGTTNTVSCDDETDPYVGHWTCKHGKHDEEPCDQCEIENGVAV